MANSPKYGFEGTNNDNSLDDELIFRQVYDQWHPKIYALANYVTKSAFMSEEVTQEVTVKIWNHRSELSHIEHMSAWIRTVTLNTVINYLKKKARERLLLENYLEVSPAQDEDTFRQIRERELAHILHGIIAKLSPQQRKVWELTRVAGMTLTQAATEMGISRTTAKEHLARAMKFIRVHLDGHIDLLVISAVTLFL